MEKKWDSAIPADLWDSAIPADLKRLFLRGTYMSRWSRKG